MTVPIFSFFFLCPLTLFPFLSWHWYNDSYQLVGRMSLKFKFVCFLMIILRLDILDKNTIEVMLCPFQCVILGKGGTWCKCPIVGDVNLEHLFRWCLLSFSTVVTLFPIVISKYLEREIWDSGNNILFVFKLPHWFPGPCIHWWTSLTVIITMAFAWWSFIFLIFLSHLLSGIQKTLLMVFLVPFLAPGAQQFCTLLGNFKFPVQIVVCNFPHMIIFLKEVIY